MSSTISVQDLVRDPTNVFALDPTDIFHIDNLITDIQEEHKEIAHLIPLLYLIAYPKKDTYLSTYQSLKLDPLVDQEKLRAIGMLLYSRTKLGFHKKYNNKCTIATSRVIRKVSFADETPAPKKAFRKTPMAKPMVSFDVESPQRKVFRKTPTANVGETKKVVNFNTLSPERVVHKKTPIPRRVSFMESPVPRSPIEKVTSAMTLDTPAMTKLFETPQVVFNTEFALTATPATDLHTSVITNGSPSSMYFDDLDDMPMMATKEDLEGTLDFTTLINANK